jgi:hypothetical protein
MANQEFEKNLKKVSSFLNISEDVLLSQPIDLLGKMIHYANEDEMFEIHKLGYNVKSVS